MKSLSEATIRDWIHELEEGRTTMVISGLEAMVREDKATTEKEIVDAAIKMSATYNMWLLQEGEKPTTKETFLDSARTLFSLGK